MDHGASMAKATTTSLQHPWTMTWWPRSFCSHYHQRPCSKVWDCTCMVFSRAATACIRRRWAAIVRATAIRDADISLYLWCVQLIRPVSRQLVIVPLHSKKMTRPCAVHRPSGEHRLLLICSPTTTSVMARASGHRTTSARYARHVQEEHVHDLCEHSQRTIWGDDYIEQFNVIHARTGPVPPQTCIASMNSSHR